MRRPDPWEEQYSRRLGAARRGDRWSLGWLLARELDWIATHAYRVTASGTTRWTARDLVQECCLAVLRAPTDPNAHSRAQFRSWLKTVLRHHVLNELRRLRPARLGEDEEAQLAAAGWPFGLPYILARTRAVRERLPFRFEASLVLRDYCGCSFDTLRVLLDCPTKKACYRLRSRALEALQAG